MSKKDLLSRIYKELLDYNNKEKKTLKNGQRIWIDISPKKITNGWSESTWKKMLIISH